MIVRVAHSENMASDDVQELCVEPFVSATMTVLSQESILNDFDQKVALAVFHNE